MSATAAEWLDSPAGQLWSRLAHSGGSVRPCDPAPDDLYHGGPADEAADPCGAGPVTVRGRRTP